MNLKNLLSIKLNKWEYASLALMFIVLLIFSLACEQPVLYALHNYSLYLDSDPFRTIILSYGAGSLSLFSRFITQYFISPISGALAISAVLTSIFAVLLTLSKKTSGKKIVIAAIPTLALYVASFNLEYLLFDKVDGSIVMNLLLGSLIAVLLAWWMQTENKISLYLSIVVTEFLYFAIGIFSPLAMFIGASAYVKKDNKIALMLAGIGLASWFGFNYLTANLLHYEIYSVALFAPLYVSHSSTFFTYSIIAMVLMIAYPFVTKLVCKEKSELTPKKLMIPGIAFIIAIIVAKFCCYNDEGFHKILRLQQLEDEEKWSEMIIEARSTTHPNTDIYAYYLEALIANGEKADEMFNFPVEWEGYNTSNFTVAHMIHYEDFAFATGNYCMSLFHAMEYYQLTGENFRRLKRMMRCGVMMEEPELAERYLKVLETSDVYSDYVKEWRKYKSDKQQLLKDQQAYKNFDSYFEPKDEWFQAYSAADFISERVNISNYKIAEARILTDLYAKDLNSFARDITIAAKIYNKAMPPKCIQEAACLCAIAGNTKPVQSINVDRNLAVNTQKVFKEIQKAGKNGKDKVKEYAGSYLYYYSYKTIDSKKYKGGELKK